MGQIEKDDSQINLQRVIDDYYRGLASLEQSQKIKRDQLRLKTYENREFDYIKQKQKLAVLIQEYEDEQEEMRELVRNQGENKEAKKYLRELRDKRLKDDQELRKNKSLKNSNFLPQLLPDKNTKIDVSQFVPTAKELIGMTPQEKADLFNRLKFIERRNKNIDDRDPAQLINKVKSGTINPCEVPKLKQRLIAQKEMRATKKLEKEMKSDGVEDRLKK